MKKRLTEAQFKKAVSFYPRMSEHVIDMARMVIVNGRTCAAAAEAYGLRRQNAERAVHKIFDVYLKEMSCPSGWTVLTVCVPTDLVESIEEIELKAKREYLGSTKQRSKK